MAWLWLLYWGLLLCSLMFSVVVTIKKNKITGLLQLLLSIVSPIWAFVFAFKRDYLSTGLESNELYFMYTKLMDGDMEVIAILILFGILIMVAFYNLSLIKKH